MKRGEIWTLRDRQYASKARPVVIIQNDAFDIFDSVILCLFTSFDSSQIEIRVPVTPSPENGLHTLSYVMTDKIVTVDKAMLGDKIGVLSDTDMALIAEHLRKILALQYLNATRQCPLSGRSDRKDDVINLCEMKYTDDIFEVEKSEYEKLMNRLITFQKRRIPERRYI